MATRTRLLCSLRVTHVVTRGLEALGARACLLPEERSAPSFQSGDPRAEPAPMASGGQGSFGRRESVCSRCQRRKTASQQLRAKGKRNRIQFFFFLRKMKILMLSLSEHVPVTVGELPFWDRLWGLIPSSDAACGGHSLRLYTLRKVFNLGCFSKYPAT